MPRGVKESSRLGRMYKHIKSSYKKKGKSEDRAEQLAAMTVNRQKRKEGRTKKK